MYLPKRKGILPTVCCKIHGPKKTKLVRVLFDSGSELSVVDRHLAAELGLQGPRRQLQIRTANGSIQETESQIMFKLSSQNNSFTSSEIDGVTLNKEINVNPISLIIL